MLVFIVLLVVALVSSSKRKKQLGDAAVQLGFTAMAEPDADLLARLTTLYAPYPVRKVSNAYRKPFASSNEFGNIGIISSYLNLPSFMLIPRFPAMPMGLGGMLENLLTMAAANAGLTEYSLVTPDFSSKYMLFVKEEERVEQVFTPEAQDWIARQEQLVARGENDFLLYNRYNLRMKNNKEVRQFSDLMDGARQLCDYLVTKKN
jgi:hypothetical protein